MTTDTKKCPFCGNIIKAEAKKCQFCNEFLEGYTREQILNVPSNSSPSYGRFSYIKQTMTDRWEIFNFLVVEPLVGVVLVLLLMYWFVSRSPGFHGFSNEMPVALLFAVLFVAVLQLVKLVAWLLKESLWPERYNAYKKNLLASKQSPAETEHEQS